MTNENITDNNKIGSAILYFRETYQISQIRLSRGLCSVATLSRIETGERDADGLLLEALLERLGKTPNEFELVLTELDYLLYQRREDIRRAIRDKECKEAADLLSQYEKSADTKSNVHMQFIVNCKALLNELTGGAVETTIELFMKAIDYTVPNFKAYKINDYFLSNSELNIIIDAIQRMIAAGMTLKARELLIPVLDYLDSHRSMEESNRLYPKVAYIAGMLYMQDKDLTRALEISTRGLEKCKGNRSMEYVGELYFIKARASEIIYKNHGEYALHKKECMKLFLEAYYTLDFCGELPTAEQVKTHLQEEYRWADTD